MSFVLDKNGDYLPVFGENTGGAESASYIPADTTYTVKTDGTGDFTKLSDAVNFLNNKWSPYPVTISMGAGTFVENDKVEIIDTYHSGIPNIIIEGAGVDSTILQNTSTKNALIFRNLRTSNIIVRNLTVENTNATPPTIVLYAAGSRVLRVANVKLKNAQYGLFAGVANSEIAIEGNLTIENCGVGGFEVQNNSILTAGSTSTISFNTMPQAIHVYRQSKVIFMASTLSFTSVTTKASIPINTQTADGYIYTDSGTI